MRVSLGPPATPLSSWLWIRARHRLLSTGRRHWQSVTTLPRLYNASRLPRGAVPSSARRIVVERFEALGKVATNLQVVCHDLPARTTVRGLLGLNFLRRFDLQISFKRGVIKLV
jgi:hypothetical protein